MTTYYVNPAHGGTDSGTEANPWQNFQSALDTAVAGDTVLCQGTQTLTVSLDIDTNSGDKTSGFILYIGTNSSWVNDGTKFIIDGNSAVIDNLLCAAALDHLWWENFESKNSSSGSGWKGTAGSGWVFLNCISSNNGANGFELNGAGNHYIRCLAHSNTLDGFNVAAYHRYLFCCSRDNSGTGVIGQNNGIAVVGCLVFDNTDIGIENVQSAGLILNTVVDGNGNDGIIIRISASSTVPCVIGSRITNHSGAGDVGIEGNTQLLVYGWNYFENNDGDNIQNSTLALEILNNGSSTNQEDQSDTNQGYVSLTEGAEDYNLRDDATLRRVAIAVPTGQ